MDDDDGAVKIRLSLPRCDLETLINGEKQRFKKLVFVRVTLGCLDLGNHPSSREDATHTLVSG